MYPLFLFLPLPVFPAEIFRNLSCQFLSDLKFPPGNRPSYQSAGILIFCMLFSAPKRLFSPVLHTPLALAQNTAVPYREMHLKTIIFRFLLHPETLLPSAFLMLRYKVPKIAGLPETYSLFHSAFLFQNEHRLKIQICKSNNSSLLLYPSKTSRH